jgi:hypothetical protein
MKCKSVRGESEKASSVIQYGRKEARRGWALCRDERGDEMDESYAKIDAGIIVDSKLLRARWEGRLLEPIWSKSIASIERTWISSSLTSREPIAKGSKTYLKHLLMYD